LADGRRTVRTWAALAVALALFAAIGTYIVRQQFEEDLQSARSRGEAEVSRLAGVVGTDLQQGQYQDVDTILREWGKTDEGVFALRVTSANGFVLGEYKRTNPAQRTLTFASRIPYSYRSEASLTLERDVSNLEGLRDRLAMQLGGAFAILAALLATFVRNNLLLRRRTEALDAANANLESEARQRRGAQEEIARLISILEGTPDFVGMADPEGRVLYLNRGARSMIGLREGSAPMSHLREAHPPWALERVTTVGIPEAMRNGIWSGEGALLHAGGREIPVSQVILAHRDSRGEVEFLSTIIRDMSAQRDTQNRLEERDRLLQRLSERVPGVIYQYRMYPDGRSCFPYASEGIRDIYEVAPAQVREDATPVFGRLHPGDATFFGATIMESFRDLSTWRADYRVVLPVRGLRWLTGEAKPERLPDGSVLWHGYIADVTERRAADEARLRLASIVDHSSDFVGLADAEGRVGYLNQASLNLIEWDASETWAGRPALDFVHASCQRTFNEELWPQVTARGHWSGELCLRNFRSGEPILTLSDCFRIDDGHGHVIGVATICRDITASRATEEALKHSEERLRQAVRTSQIGIFDHDHRDSTLYWSAEQRRNFGWGMQEPVTPATFDFCIHPDDAAALAQALRKALDPSGEGLFEMDHRIIRRDGEVRWLTTRSRTFFEGEGAARRPVRTIGASVDITERRQSDERLRIYRERLEELVAERTRELSMANRELESFAYSVSHDLRTPLRGIDGYASMLEEDAAGALDGRSREHLQRIRAAAQRMGTLITDLLRLSRVMRADLRRESVDLSAIARRIASDLDRQDARRHVTWRIADGLAANADPELVQLALENLLENAWKYSGKNPDALIEFFAAPADGGAKEYCVRDNGAGFDMRYADMLFQPFKRLHAQHEFDGVGVGLATVQRVVERHGGTIRGEGTVGRGARFCFTLPGEAPPVR
jgi:PAS domain S-box-containing protein